MAETKSARSSDDVRQRLAAQRPSATHGPTEESEEIDNPEHAGMLGLHEKIGNRGVGELIGLARAVPGRAIEPSARAPFEASFGRSFADVELHEGPTVDAVTGAMGASAFAAGDHIYVHSKVPAEMPAGREVLG